MTSEIQAKLGDLKKYVRLLKTYQKHSKKEITTDLTLRGAVERYLQLCIEIVIEISEMVIATEGFEKPETYKDVILTLGKNRILEKKFAQWFSLAAGFRNILIHRYGDIDVDEVYTHLQNDVKDFDVFARQIAVYLKSRM